MLRDGSLRDPPQHEVGLVGGSATRHSREASDGRRPRRANLPPARRAAFQHRRLKEDIINRHAFARALVTSSALLALSALAPSSLAHAQSTSASPWPAGDEFGMANTLGTTT